MPTSPTALGSLRLCCIETDEEELVRTLLIHAPKSVIGGATVLKHAGGATFAESDLRDLLEREQACGTQTTLTLTLCSRGRRRVIPCACVGLAWAHA